MALRINHIQVLLMALNGPEFDYHSQSIMAEAVHALEAELHRLTHGPFTLAEAVASGRPFRRKGWADYWTARSFDPSDSNEDVELVKYGSNPERCVGLGFEDLSAADYELQPLDKQKT